MPPKAGDEVWKYGINDRVNGPDKLPDAFETTGTIRGDYLQVAKLINVPGLHPAFKPPKAKVKKLKKDAAACATAGEATAEGDVAETLVEPELPVFTVQSVRMDRIAAHILGLILPEMRHLKVLRFSDCRFDLEMLRLLRLGLTGQSSVECLQVDWNPMDQALTQSSRPGQQSGRASPKADGQDHEEDPGDPAGIAIARFVDTDCVLEALSMRSCNISHIEIPPVAAALKQCPWQLRQLNLWENGIDDSAVADLAAALEEYRGLEFLGLGRNLITDRGVKVLLTCFSSEIVDEATKTTKAEAIKNEDGRWAAEAKAKAKAKAKPKAEGERRRREPTCFGCSHDVLDEKPAAEGSDAGPSWILRRFCEMKCLSLMENPIKNLADMEKLQPFGPKRAELTLVGTPVATAILARYPDLSAKDKKAFVFPGSAQEVPGGDAGWALRLV